MMILLILIAFPFSLFANNFPHIWTHGEDYWNLTGDIEQAKWLAKHHDLIVGAGINEAVYDAMKLANPNVKIMPYIAYNTYELNIQNWIKNWCVQNGYNFEETFYHYYYDTQVKFRGTNPGTILVRGYGGGTAKTLQESRVPSSWAQYNNGINQQTGEITRLNICPTSIAWRRGYEQYALAQLMTINAGRRKYSDGLFLDTFDGTVGDFYPQLERTIEMRNLRVSTASAAKVQAKQDIITAMKELQSFLTVKIGKTIVVSPNVGDIDYFYLWEKDFYADRSTDYAPPGVAVYIENMVRGGSNTSRIQRLKQTYDSMNQYGLVFISRNETTITNVSERVKQFVIASHYLINHPNYCLMYHCGSASFYGGNPPGQLYTTHWHKNLEYDLGTPVRRSGQDAWGQTNTDRFFVFASAPTYTILGREYTNALVLAKFGSQGGIANAGTNPTTHSLNGIYRLLLPDNSLGPAITQITLGASEGAILIKTVQRPGA